MPGHAVKVVCAIVGHLAERVVMSLTATVRPAEPPVIGDWLPYRLSGDALHRLAQRVAPRAAL
jgi:hypothetical protein